MLLDAVAQRFTASAEQAAANLVRISAIQLGSAFDEHIAPCMMPISEIPSAGENYSIVDLEEGSGSYVWQQNNVTLQYWAGGF